MASLPVLILVIWVEQSALEKEILSVEEKHLLVAKNVTGDLERYIKDVESSFTLLSNNLVKGNFVMDAPRHLDSLFLRCIVITDKEFRITSQVIGTSQPPIKEFKKQTRDVLPSLFAEASNSSGEIVYSDLVRRDKDNTVFYLVKALKNNEFAIGLLSTEHILQAQKQVTFGRRGHAAIVDLTGRAIAHPIKSWVDTMKDMSFLPPVQEMKQGKTGVSKFYTPAMKADMVAGYTVVPGVGWGVMIPQPFEELEERANDVQIIGLIIAVIGIVVSIIFSWFIAGMLSAPIQTIVDAVKSDISRNKTDPFENIHLLRRFIPVELRVLVNSFNEMRSKLNLKTLELHDEIEESYKEIELRNKRLHEQSLELLTANQKLQKTNLQLEVLNCTDALTGLYNCRHFDETLEKEFSYSKRNNKIFSLIMIDLDYFKTINDEYGHAAGDHVLHDIASLIIKSVRRSDIICRVGGEEFTIICRDTDETNVHRQADKLRTIIERHKVMYSGKEINITASMGVSTCEINLSKDCVASDLYKQADIAMYQSKNSGRNKVTHYQDMDETTRKRGKP